MARKNLFACMTAAALLTAGCASLPPEERLNREMAGVNGKPPQFVNGYRDGCQSGLSAAGDRSFAYAKDLSKANTPDYKLGWEDGFRVCQSREAQRNNDRNSYDGYAYPWLPRTGVSIGVTL